MEERKSRITFTHTEAVLFLGMVRNAIGDAMVYANRWECRKIMPVYRELEAKALDAIKESS